MVIDHNLEISKNLDNWSLGDDYKELEHSTQFFSQIAKDCSCTMYIPMKVAIVWHIDYESTKGMTFKKLTMMQSN